MKKELTDQQFDQMMRTIVSDAALDDAAVNDIADSRQMWWAVKRQIAQQRETRAVAWPPNNIIRRIFMIGVPTTAAAALLISLFVFKSSSSSVSGVAGIIPVNNVAMNIPVAPDVTNAVEPTVVKSESHSISPKRVTAVIAKFAASNRTVSRSNSKAAKATIKTEIKTEFIALSYARNPESGQIVRVKVPSSMMVTLGLVASVEKPANLVDAEVLVGDDGLSRAIRFIR